MTTQLTLIPAHKTCTRCNEAKPVDQFYKDKSAKDGLRSACKKCHRATSHAWQEANRERTRENARAWREANRERSRENARAWYEANRERASEKKRAWREANRERHRELSHAWQEANRERTRENARAWQKANRERTRENARAWRKANPERAREIKRRRRARKKCAVPQRWIVDHNLGDPMACWWCGRGLLGATIHLDHVHPIELGGPAVPNNEVNTCHTCNQRKHAKHPLVWIAELVLDT